MFSYPQPFCGTSWARARPATGGVGYLAVSWRCRLRGSVCSSLLAAGQGLVRGVQVLLQAVGVPAVLLRPDRHLAAVERSSCRGP